MKTILPLLFLVALPVLAEAQAAKLSEAEAKAALSKAPARTAATTPTANDQGADRGYSPIKEASREYERNFVVIKKTDGSTEKRPLLDLPVLFVKDSTEIVDAQSRENLRTLSGIIRELEAKEHARFVIEGHSSAEGDAMHNQGLSVQRARAIQGQLALLAGESTAACLTPQGFGATHARSPATASEGALQQDRRVLIVRAK